jgi:hypothetical protein
LVSLDLLSSLDGLIWLQSGSKVGKLFQQHQTTVSRNQKKCAQIFGITLNKFKSKWDISGDSLLLQREREVHQVARLLGKCRPRIEVDGWSDSPLFNPPPSNWVVGASNNVNNLHHLRCLKNRIIDAYLCPLNHLPAKDKDLKIISIQSQTNLGFLTLEQNSNAERISALIETLEKT